MDVSWLYADFVNLHSFMADFVQLDSFLIFYIQACIDESLANVTPLLTHLASY